MPKAGTHSFRRVLREHLAEEDLEQVGLFVSKRFPFAQFEGIRQGHITLQQIRPCLESDKFAE